MVLLFIFLLFGGEKMELKNKEVKDGFYRFEFEGEMDNQVMKVAIQFYEIWSLTDPHKKENFIEEFGKAIGFFMAGQKTQFPYDVRNDLEVIPVHIPHELGRNFFKTCMNYFIERTDAPMRLKEIEHPGYPLVTVTFDKTVIAHKETVFRWIETIMNAIQTCEVTFEDLPNEVKEDEDDFDEVDEDVIVEFEIDDELAAHIKTPAEPEYLPLEGDEDE